MNLTITIDGAKELGDDFEYVRRGLVDFRQLGTWKAVASNFRKIEKQAFDSEGGTTKSGKWKALKPKYAAAKLKRWGPVPILTASGDLYRSLTQEGAKDAIYQETAQELVIGTSDKKAGYHQSGTSRMPKRSPIDFTPEQEKEMVQPVYDKLKQLIDNTKLRDKRGF